MKKELKKIEGIIIFWSAIILANINMLAGNTFLAVAWMIFAIIVFVIIVLKN